MQLKEIKYGIAFCNDDGTIEINSALRKYPALFAMVMKHESEHLAEKDWLKNIIIDIKDQFNIRKQIMLTGFILRHPSAWLSYSPIFIENGRISYNLFMILYWLLFISIIVLCSGGR